MANGTNNKQKKVTDPALLKQLNAKVTDPAILAQLNGQAPAQESLSAGDVFMGALQNTPESYRQFGENILSPVLHPVETGKNLLNLGVATAKTAMVPFLAAQDPQVQKTFAPILNFYKERYGGWENVKRTIASDPVGFLADLSVFLQGGGAALKGVGQVARSEGVAGAVSKGLKTAVGAGERTGILPVATGMTERAYQVGARGTLTDALKAVEDYKALAKNPPTLQTAQAMQAARETAEGFIQKATGTDLSRKALTMPQVEQKLAEIQAQPNLLERAGTRVTQAGRIFDPNPVTVASNIPRAVPSKIPRRLYGSSVKFSTVLPPEQRATQIATGLREGILPTESGLEKLRTTIDEVNRSISATIQKGKKAGDVVSANDITSRLDGLRDFFKNTINPDTYLSQLDEIEAAFVAAHGEKIPVDVAQQVKQNTYSLLRKAYGEMKTAAVEANKQIARGIKEELAKKYPQLGALNARDSELIQLESSIERSVGRINNRDIIGIGTPIAGAAGAAMFGAKTAGVEVGALKSIIDNPRVKAALAIALKKARERGPRGGLAPIMSTFGRTVTDTSATSR